MWYTSNLITCYIFLWWLWWHQWHWHRVDIFRTNCSEANIFLAVLTFLCGISTYNDQVYSSMIIVYNTSFSNFTLFTLPSDTPPWKSSDNLSKAKSFGKVCRTGSEHHWKVGNYRESMNDLVKFLPNSCRFFPLGWSSWNMLFGVITA